MSEHQRHDFRSKEIRYSQQVAGIGGKQGTYAWCVCSRWTGFTPILSDDALFLHWFDHARMPAGQREVFNEHVDLTN